MSCESTMTTDHHDHADRLWRLSEAVRRSAPLIHNITNQVVQNDTADAIAAVGGTQMTLHNEEEAREAAAIAGALAVNPGTPDAAWLRCAEAALDVACNRETPWVLDPVAAGLTRYRTEAMQTLLQRGPSVLKGNASEILALAGEAVSGHGADSVHSVDQAARAAEHLATRHACVVVVSGERDLVIEGTRRMRLANGRPLMGRMIGSGCMLTAVVACFLAVAKDPFEAAAAAVAHFTVAGEVAAERAEGPGTLKPRFLDALYNLDRETLARRLRIVDA